MACLPAGSSATRGSSWAGERVSPAPHLATRSALPPAPSACLSRRTWQPRARYHYQRARVSGAAPGNPERVTTTNERVSQAPHLATPSALPLPTSACLRRRTWQPRARCAVESSRAHRAASKSRRRPSSDAVPSPEPHPISARGRQARVAARYSRMSRPHVALHGGLCSFGNISDNRLPACPPREGGQDSGRVSQTSYNSVLTLLFWFQPLSRPPTP
jgi:hypothetical protein